MTATAFPCSEISTQKLRGGKKNMLTITKQLAEELEWKLTVRGVELRATINQSLEG